jgi:hypothetical protein
VLKLKCDEPLSTSALRHCIGVGGAKRGDDEEEEEEEDAGRGLHSSTSQLNLNSVGHEKAACTP